MNKIVMIALLILQLANCYPKTAQVTEIDSTTNIIALEDDNGDIWEFESEDVNSWQEYDMLLLITDDAKRSSATTRKCRASKVKVLGFYDFNKNELPLGEAYSNRDITFTYRKGETIEIEDFDENRWEECSTGIHFFHNF